MIFFCNIYFPSPLSLLGIWKIDVIPEWDKTGILPVWDLNNIWRLGIPSTVRGEVWKRAIGNRLVVTPEVFAAVTQQVCIVNFNLILISFLIFFFYRFSDFFLFLIYRPGISE